MSAIGERLTRLIARLPVGVHAKLVAAFLTLVFLLITVGALALILLGQAHGRAEELVKIQRKMAAYRQLQNDTTAQLYTVASALLVPDETTLAATLRQLSQFGTTSTASSSWPATRSKCSARSNRPTTSSARW